MRTTHARGDGLMSGVSTGSNNCASGPSFSIPACSAVPIRWALCIEPESIPSIVIGLDVQRKSNIRITLDRRGYRRACVVYRLSVDLQPLSDIGQTLLLDDGNSAVAGRPDIEQQVSAATYDIDEFVNQL